MAKEGIDVLVLPANHSRWDQMMADSRYLSAIGGYGTEALTIFPAEGDVTVGIFNRCGWWKQVQDWVTDVRDCRNRWADLVIERLGELDFPARGRIGVSGMGGLVRAPDGLVPWTMMEKIRRAYPEAHIVDATTMMQDIRAVKSAEEIRIMTRSVRIIESMLDAMRDETRPGVTEKHLYATLTNTMLESGGELPSLLIMGSGPELNTGQFVPTERRLNTGDLVHVEAEAHYCGYSGQIVQSVSLGKPPRAYADAHAVSEACFETLLPRLKAGTRIGTLMDLYERTLKKEGKGRLAFAHPMMHARGLGDERPAQFGDVGLEEYRRIELKSGMTFVLKPRARNLRARRTGQTGDTVVVTAKGGRRLGTRNMGLWIA
jgi:Xaa-Pro aminopeptidase